jgi:methylated-DNA-protein-cysteine methyltransferase-like protein
MSAALVKARVLAVVRDIPPGRVTTYGAVGKHLRVTARQAARALSTLTAEESAEVPWHRVVGAGGVIRTEGQRQGRRLRAEGVVVSPSGRVLDFDLVFHEPSSP